MFTCPRTLDSEIFLPALSKVEFVVRLPAKLLAVLLLVPVPYGNVVLIGLPI